MRPSYTVNLFSIRAPTTLVQGMRGNPMIAASVRVLVLGAGGMIGKAIQNEARGVGSLELVPASHQRRPGYIHVEYESLLTAAAWGEVLQRHRII